MKKIIKISRDFDIECENVGNVFITSIIQNLPWRPVVESRTAYDKDSGNNNYKELKAKYSEPLFKKER